MHSLGLIAGLVGAVLLFAGSVVTYRGLNMYNGFGALPQGQQIVAKGASYIGILLVSFGFLLPLLAPDEIQPIERRLDGIRAKLEEVEAGLIARPTPTATLTYKTHQPIPITPEAFPLTESPDCKPAGSGLIASGGPLCYSSSPAKGFLSLTIRVADACTSVGIPNAEVVLKLGRWTLTGVSERAAAVTFLNVPIPKGKYLRGVTIIAAPGYRGAIEAQRYGADSYVGNTELIPIKKVDRPEDCKGVTFYTPKHLRRD